MIDQRPTIIWLNAFLIVLTTVATASRAGRRLFLVHHFSWHDGELVIYFSATMR